MASLLLVVKHEQEARHAAEQMRRIAYETATTPLDNEVHRTTAGGDERKLRGIPAIGRGVAGAIAGTIPHSVR